MSGFLERYRTGYFRNLLSWEELERLWATLREQAEDDWYVYAVGEPPPAAPLERQKLLGFMVELDALLRHEHQEEYCGIVYVDNPERPGLVKIYDPHNLGSVCGSGSAPPPLPGWVLSRRPPTELQAPAQPEGRRRWWQRLFGT